MGIALIWVAIKHGQKIHDKVTTLLGTSKKEMVDPEKGLPAKGVASYKRYQTYLDGEARSEAQTQERAER
jgi:hypothetical protein